MPTVNDILNQVAGYLGRSSTSDLTINGYNFGLAAINQARQFGERQHEFKYSETNAFLSISSTGTSLQNTSAAIGATAIISAGATPSPDITGAYTLQGTFANRPLYLLINSASPSYALWYSIGTGQWIISDLSDVGVAGLTDYFWLATTSSLPDGTYTAFGTFTGSPVVQTSAVNVKRVKYVSLPVAGGDYQPIEFLTNDQYLSRVRLQVGRQHYDPSKTLAQLGSTLLGNPMCYQNAQTLYLAPASLTFPIVAQLNVVQWMPDYTSTGDSDFFTNFGPEFLMWQTVLQINKNFKWLSVRQEGGLEEDKVIAMRDAALQSLVAWDVGIESGTSKVPTPTVNPVPPSEAPTQPAP